MNAIKSEDDMKYPQVLYQYQDRALEPFRPGNGTEGMMFSAAFCDRCFHDRTHDCDIVGMTMAYDENDPEYPKEWIYSIEGWPICTKFQPRDSDSVKEPEPVFDDPNQLVMNFHDIRELV